MSQNDRLLSAKGVPVLNKRQKDKIRRDWQRQTWDDMLLSLNSFGKYIMLRPTGFGKTFTCACACNIGANEYNKDPNGKCDTLLLNNGNQFHNKRLADIHKKKVIFVYVSEILKQTFDEYDKADYTIDGDLRNTNRRDYDKERIIPQPDGRSRVQYETYASVALHWGDEKYLREILDIKNVGLIIFDEVQRMGAPRTAEALDKALKVIKKFGIFYIGATATHERSTGYDVCDKYFRHDYPNTSRYDYCWGEHIFTLENAFERGLLIPPEYVCIADDINKVNEYRTNLRHTKESMLAEIKTMDANNPERNILIKNMKELQDAVIKNSSKIIHDSMIKLYNCGSYYLTNNEMLDAAEFCSLDKPDNLPNYMRFLVFTPDQKSLKGEKIVDSKGNEVTLGNMVNKTYDDFNEAFGRYGYRIRTTIISSANSTEKDNVHLIDKKLSEDEKKEIAKEKRLAKQLGSKLVSEDEIELGRAVVPQDMVIDLIFSINMLNVGYHVNNLTGLIFKRWTASNQIFLQQLGRCLSSVSDMIPIVFDYVNVLDSRGITSPLYTYDKQNKKVTENADGTTNTESDNKKKKANKNIYGDIRLDNSGLILPTDIHGNAVNPTMLNKIDAKYILIDTESASVENIVKRCKVYEERKTSKNLYNLAYKLYSNQVIIKNNHLESNYKNITTLSEALRIAIVISDKKAANSANLTINFKAFLEFLRNNNMDTYVLYDALDEYIKTKGKCNKFKSISAEINSILSASKTSDNSSGTNIKILIDKNKISEFKSNKEIIKVLKNRCFNPKTDIIYY